MTGRILILALAVLGTGCRSKAERYLDDHPDRPGDVRSAILEARVVPGMTFEEVRIARGVPHRIEPIEDDQIWYYGDPSGVGVGVAGVRVHLPLIAAEGVTQIRFEDGRVVEVAG